MRLIDIVIVNWNAGRQLFDCLHALTRIRQDTFHLDRVVVVDNASADGSLEGLGALDLPLVVLRNDVNRGFAAGCNQGAHGSRADYLLFLNPDTRLFPDSLHLPVTFLERPESANIGICGIDLVDEEGHSTTACSRFPTLRIFFGESTRLSRYFPRVFPPHFLTPAECAANREVDQVMGAFYLIRRPLFEGLGGFDERFFVYYEDVDLALRARQHGFRSYYLKEATAFHRGCGTSDQVRAQRLFYSLSSRLAYAAKHFPPVHARLLLLHVFTLELGGRLLKALFSGTGDAVGETLSGYRLLVRHVLREGAHA